MSKSITITFSEGRISAVNNIKLSPEQSRLVEPLLVKEKLPFSQEVLEAVLFKAELIRDFSDPEFEQQMHFQELKNRVATEVQKLGVHLPTLHNVLYATFNSKFFAQQVADSMSDTDHVMAEKRAKVFSNKMMLALNTVLTNS